MHFLSPRYPANVPFFTHALATVGESVLGVGDQPAAQGLIQRYEGLEPLLARHGEHISVIDLNPIGQPRRDWKQSVVGDAWFVVRHPDLGVTLEIADKLGTDLRIEAG
ncbi:MAG: hypothetical protein ABL998_10640 [Planctomycetota bacterium]